MWTMATYLHALTILHILCWKSMIILNFLAFGPIELLTADSF